MVITFMRELTDEEKERLRTYVGFYRGVASFIGDNVLEIRPKDKFSEEELMTTLESLQIPIENVDVTS
ncbi:MULTISPECIES: hypothetical protein [Bacillaceae]|uniref:Uncharacterized protein n=1 Tax=Evansella alkalicola TaxID=745819 RepID=A0ABS6K237_9BACI|nr:MULTISPECIES: hypothetical protein [Bacillaceae]MBU9723657.1 hypothetical protein [Bacillus alkalicola]